jgi:hypothetical protein
MKKNKVFISLSLAALVILAGFLVFSPRAEQYTTTVTIEVIKIEMLEDVNLDGNITKGAFTVALNDKAAGYMQKTRL